MRKEQIYVPHVWDREEDIDSLFAIWQKVVDKGPLDVTIDFTKCDFLSHIGVAFLGGLARFITFNSGSVFFDWDTVCTRLRKHLETNAFLSTFNNFSVEPRANIPYREDQKPSTELVETYLKENWLGGGLINLSESLKNEIVGRVWEIYANAFEHSCSPIGVFSCGQYYPQYEKLELVVIDFGVGIPYNINQYIKKQGIDESISSNLALKLAFKDGISTKVDTKSFQSRGLGLELLKEFVRKNKGRLQIFSHDGYAVIDENNEVYLKRKSFFHGTLVNITFMSNQTYYRLANEDIDEPFF